MLFFENKIPQILKISVIRNNKFCINFMREKSWHFLDPLRDFRQNFGRFTQNLKPYFALINPAKSLKWSYIGIYLFRKTKKHLGIARINKFGVD